MASQTLSDIVLRLKDDYLGGSMYGEQSLVVNSGKITYNTGFLGSSTVVFLTSSDSIVHESPACIAAPLVNLVAMNAITMGMAGQGLQPVPVRLFAPISLTITTKHLFIGDIAILTEPKDALIFCSKLILSKSSEEAPAYFEVVRSWAINDDMEVEVVSID